MRVVSILSYLGTVEVAFDLDMTLATLQDIRSMKHFQAKYAKSQARLDAEVLDFTDNEEDPLNWLRY